MKRLAIIVFILGLFSSSGYAPDPEIEIDWAQIWTNQLGGEYRTNNMHSSFRIYPSDYDSRKIAQILSYKDTIK